MIVARHRGIHLSVTQLVREHQLGKTDPTPEQLLAIARTCGLRAAVTPLRFRGLLRLDGALPVIALLRNGNAMVLLRTEAQQHMRSVVLEDPHAGPGAPLTLDEQRFVAGWSGRVILVKRDYRLRDDEQPFGLRMIIGQLLHDRGIAREIGIAALLLGLLAIAPIMFWRLLIDRVLYYQSLDTLLVLCLAMAILVTFETAFGYLRRHHVLHVTRRVDATLTIHMFTKLLNLPVDFFERNSVGEIARDMNEIWKIRRFLVGQLFGTLLNSFVIVVILPILFFFSAVLTGIVLGVCALIIGWLLIMLPVIRRKAGAVFIAEGIRGSYLVETLHGIRTVKSLALDARRRHDWDVYTARVADLRFDEGRTANLIQTVVLPLERVMTSGVFALAVYLAVSNQNQVYVGALVAFMMLTMRLAQPLVQLAHLLPEYDEAQFAVQSRLPGWSTGRPRQGVAASGVRTPLVGRIEFNEVRFRYPGSTVPALDDVSFTVPEGTIFGIMGRSGSGKTTVTRLLQLLHSNYQGLIKIDGNDLREIDVDHLRSSLGVVLQENFLFRGTRARDDRRRQVRCDASKRSIGAARLAGAEEFIERLPLGYETYIQEGSTNLSGGQRQRLAIARALIANPRILILDEATSALDAESEAIVNANLLRIAERRTLIIISHRLSSLVAADSILVLERGRVLRYRPPRRIAGALRHLAGTVAPAAPAYPAGAGHDIIPLRVGAGM